MSIFNDQLTTAGFTRVPLTTIIETLQAAYFAGYGADADLDPRSPDGQVIGIFAEMFDDLNGMAQAALAVANPNGASGAMLANLAYLTGIARNPASYSSAPAHFAGTPGTVIGTAKTVRSSIDGTLWSPIADVTIGGGGTADGTLRCTTIGPPAAGSVPAGSLTDIATQVTGWASVTNDVGTAGYLQEGDPNLRIRRQQATAVASQGTTDGLQAALKAMTGVSDAVVWENNTTAPIAIPSGGDSTVNPNTVRAIVKVVGGGPADPTGTTSFADPIARKIFTLKGNGCGTQGAVSKAPEDSLGVAHAIHYDVATALEVGIRISLTRRVNWPADGGRRIQAAVAAWAAGLNAATGKPNLQIGGDDRGMLSWTDVVASFINSVPGFDFISLEFSADSGATWTTSPHSLPIPFGSFVSIAIVFVLEY